MITAVTGCMSEDMEIDSVSTAEDVVNRIEESYPEIGGMLFKIAVNQKIVTGEEVLAEGDVMALLPPFSGG